MGAHYGLGIFGIATAGPSALKFGSAYVMIGLQDRSFRSHQLALWQKCNGQIPNTWEYLSLQHNRRSKRDLVD